MKDKGQLLTEPQHISEVRAGSPPESSSRVVTTRDHEVIRQWAADRSAEPATGEATTSGPATRDVNDGGAGVRFNFPGVGAFRPIGWDEWFADFDRHDYMFVYELDPQGLPSYRYRIVHAADLSERVR